MKNIIITLLILIPTVFFSQSETYIKQESSKEVAQNQIHQLKSGTLLVRLYNKNNVIEALESKGMEKRAKMVREKQRATNTEIISSFKNFTFCEVYFFYSSDSPFLLEGEYSKVELFKELDGERENSLVDPNFFVADFGFLKNEESTNSTDPDKGKNGKTKVEKYKGTSKNTSKRCMFLRDSNLKYLESPFPYTVWFHPTPIQNLTYEKVIEKMDKQLHEFYVKNK